MNKDAAIEINDLTVAYKDNPVLWDIDLKVPSGVIMGIAGPNGAGKSTLIKTVINLVKPIAGKIQILGDNYDNVRKKSCLCASKKFCRLGFPGYCN